jgi:adenylylsulfate kinase
MKKKYLTWHNGLITKEHREQRNQHKGFVVWLTGFSAAGKSTIARRVERRLFKKGIQTYVLDGDNIRHGLNKDLGFSPGDRAENIRRVAEVAKLFADAGMIVFTAFISPYRKDRNIARALIGRDRFIEVYVQADLETCQKRDPKGIYKKAVKGLIRQFTGISASYEVPLNPEIKIDTEKLSIQESSQKIIDYLVNKKIIKS